jgi:hypothetical protein
MERTIAERAARTTQPVISLKFTRANRPELHKGPFACVRFEGEAIRTARGGPLLARHENRYWRVDGQAYARIDCETRGRVKVHFERLDGSRSQSFGSLHGFFAVDGVAYAGGRVLAFADVSMQDWYCYLDNRHWPHMIVQAE